MTISEYFAPRFGFGWLIALIVFILCIVLAVLGAHLTPVMVLGLIGALALARLT
jgi:hypothetical protein